MSHDTIYVGLDYHQKSIQVCVLDARGEVLLNRSCENSSAAIKTIIDRFDAADVRVAIEACCGSADLADELVDRFGWCVSLAHPGYVSRMKQSPDKTDFGDARLLADLLRVGYLPKVWLAPEYIRELRRLVRYREQLAAAKKATKLRCGALLREQRLRCPHARPWTVAWLDWLGATPELSEQGRWVMDQHLTDLEHLKTKLAAVEARMKACCGDDALIEFLMTVPGIGFLTAITIRAEIGRFDRFVSGKQLSRFCGLSPRNASSGERQADAGMIKAGRPQLRVVLIEAAHRLARYEPRWKDMATRLRRKGKPGSVVAAAIANRWMRWLFHQVQNPNLAA